MAKETFQRNKPHVNIGTIGHVEKLEDSLGALLVNDSGLPVEYWDLTFHSQSQTSSSPQTASVAFPINDDFVFDPTSSGPAVSIDFNLDVRPTETTGDPTIDVTLAIIQGGHEFIATRSVGPPGVSGPSSDWTTLGQKDLLPEEFSPIGGGAARVDFSQPFQFGYAFTGHYSDPALSVELGVDNMHVEITTVPEPSSLFLAASMAVVFLWRRFWRS